MVELLMYLDGSTLLADDDHGSMEVLDSATPAKSMNHLAPRHSREVFMAGHPPENPYASSTRYSRQRRNLV
jgi:hypothetical protein